MLVCCIKILRIINVTCIFHWLNTILSLVLPVQDSAMINTSTNVKVWKKARSYKHTCTHVPYNGNYLWKKKIMNLANLEAFTNVFLHFLFRLEFLYMKLPES